MIRRGLVKAIVALSALGGCATPRPGVSTATPAVTVAARESDAPPPAPPPDETPTLTGLTAEELAALRPLLTRGPASVVRNPDGGRDARITLLTRTDATPETVRRVITTPGDYGTFMPILRGVDVLSQHGNRTGFRFHVAAPLFDVTALCAMRAASARRVDVDIIESEIGPGASRWDLLPDGAGTVVSLSTWGDPSQGHWLLRMVARRSPSAIAGMNISVDTVLALGAVRRAEILSGRNLPVRPAEGAVAAGELSPPEDGPWLALARDAMVVSTRMTPDGSVQQVTVVGWAAASPQAVLTRLADVPSYPAVWGSVREVEVLPSAPGAPADSVRFRSVVETPLVRLEGEQRMEREGNILRHIGLTGDFADAAHRWDVREAPGGGSYVMLTGGADTARAGGITRALMARDPWLMAGFAGSWKIVWLRNALPRDVSSSLDPLRYGLRALDAMARSRASVAVPPRVDDDAFARELRLRPPPPDGAAMSLRLFSEAPDDATALVTGEKALLTLSPPPGRAVPLFEAQAAARQWDDDDGLSLGLPLVTFTQHGTRRAAPLFSVAARAVWRAGKGEWKAPAGARWGATLDAPTAMVISVDEEGSEWALHAGVWDALFGLEGDALAVIARVADGDLGAMVRAATKVLGGEGEEEFTVPEGALTREDLRALGEVVARVAHPRAELSCAPHALLTLAPQGDPTRGLRAELKEMLKDPAPRSGPLGVFLGAKARKAGAAPQVSCGAVPPTPSQSLAASRFEGTQDLVAVRGPPGCGKTALLHHLAAHVIASCALDGTWSRGPGERESPWALVVSSTNNHAVDHALAPFVTVPDGVMPAGLRLGNRRVLEEVTLPTLLRVAECLSAPGETLPEARARFDAAFAPWRTYLAQRASRATDRAAHASREASLRVREETLRAALSAEVPTLPAVLPAKGAMDEARNALASHLEAAHKLVKIHLHGAKPSETRARETWAKANRNRGPAIARVLDALEIAVPFDALGNDPAADIASQIAAMDLALSRLDAARVASSRGDLARELDEVTREIAALKASDEPEAPLPDPSLAPLALAVRDAWARTHRGYFLRHIADLRARFEEVSAAPGRRRPLSWVLRALSPLFPVAGCTLLSMRASFPLDDEVITRLVIDEAGQCAPVYAAPALRRATRAMLTGDTAQLPPVYALDDRLDARLARDLDAKAVAPFRMGSAAMTSAQAVAEQRVEPVALVEHFRSQPEIVTLASAWSGYALDVRTPARSLAHLAPWLRAPALLLEVEGRGERGGDGVVNESEARRAVAAVERLLRDGVEAHDIAVLTPFVGQSARIERALRASGVAGEHGVLVRTVHRLQGGERRVVVLSVTATAPRHLRWLEEHPHLLHVATSRAQDHLVVLASPVALASPGLAPLAALPRIGQPSGVRSESAR